MKTKTTIVATLFALSLLNGCSQETKTETSDRTHIPVKVEAPKPEPPQPPILKSKKIKPVECGERLAPSLIFNLLRGSEIDKIRKFDYDLLRTPKKDQTPIGLPLNSGRFLVRDYKPDNEYSPEGHVPEILVYTYQNGEQQIAVNTIEGYVFSAAGYFAGIDRISIFERILNDLRKDGNITEETRIINIQEINKIEQLLLFRWDCRDAAGKFSYLPTGLAHNEEFQYILNGYRSNQ